MTEPEANTRSSGAAPRERSQWLVLDSLMEGCQIIDHEFRYLYLNDAAARHGRYSKEELLGRTMPEMYPGVERTPLFAALRRCLETRRPELFDNQFTYPSGETAWFRLSIQPVPEGLFILSLDISDQKRITRQLTELNEELEARVEARVAELAAANRDLERLNRAIHTELVALLEQLPALVWMCDRNLRFVSVVGSPLSEWGLSQDHLMGASVLDEVDRSGAHERALGGEPQKYEMARAGKTYEVRLSPARDPDGRIWRVVGVAVDVTPRLELEGQLAAAQRMESVGRLAGGVAHDFNNLLTVIKSYASFIGDALEESDPLYEDAGAIRDAAHRASALIRQLLAFSRREVLSPEVLDVNHSVRELEKMLRRLLGEDVSLESDLAGDLLPVQADPAQVDQVIVNLAVNARDAMPEGGQLRIETRNIELLDETGRALSGLDPGVYVRLSITDTGEGIDDAHMGRIFEPFFTTKGPTRGTGLGLSTVYSIVRRMGGDIRVQSARGRGARFDIFWPAAEEALTARGTRRVESAPARGTETILVVEDDAPLRRAVTRALRAAGYRVLDAGTMNAALGVIGAAGEGVHLLLTDCILPDGTGDRAAAALRAKRPSAGVLYMSGYGGELVDKSRGADALITKPFAPDALLARVRQVLDAPPAAG